MSSSFAWKSGEFGGLTPQQLELLYEPIVLEHTLQKAGKLPAYAQEDESPETYETEFEDLRAFKFYVNKLAQVCDNERGGDTISALAVLQGTSGPHYVFGSNWKDKRALETTESFMRALLTLVGKKSDDVKTMTLGKQALRFILLFNIPRLREYLNSLTNAVKECLENCRKKEEDEGKSRLGYVQPAISEFQTLINVIVEMEKDKTPAIISQRAKDGEMTRSEPWCKLRHFLGRWISYRKAALGIVAISERWPALFQDFEITMIPSGTRLPNPLLRSDLTSSIIMKHIIDEDKIEDPELQKAADGLPQLQIDDVIRAHYASRKFKPLLHAEVLVYEYLLNHEQAATESYWNRWNYIGSTLQGDKPCVRSSHGNLYRNWRLPEFHEHDDNENDNHDEARDEILKRIAHRMREDVVRTLREKRIRWKARDSNTNSSVPEFLRSLVNTSQSMEDSDRESFSSTTLEKDENMVVLEHATGDMDLKDGDE
ncbi:hypothetical protein FGRMN_2147 [Fusarium graminum]|nr:hypothetical protein FGRMN_2147 [Fusarium graminum]